MSILGFLTPRVCYAGGMKSLLIIVIILGGLLAVYGVPRLFKTLYLIVRITPYEQTITDAPAIVILGDSTGYGTGATNNTQTIAGRIGTDFPTYTVVNISKNGRTIGELKQALAAEIQLPQAALILLQIGGNDILQKHDAATVARELQELFALAQAKAGEVVMLSSGNVGTAAAYVGTPDAAKYDALSREFRDMFMAEATQAKVVYVDLFTEPEADVFYLEPELYLSIDGLHPSDAGYGVWYQSLAPVLKELLPE